MSTRRLMVVLVPVFAVAAVTANTASAAFVLSTEPCNGNTPVVHNLCWNTTKALAESEPLELVGEEEVTGKGGPILFVVPSIPIEIECKSAEGVGTNRLVKQLVVLGIGATNSLSQGELEFRECALVGSNAVATKCAIPTNEVTKALTGEATSNTTGVAEPASGGVFIELEFKSKAGQTCPATVIGKRKVTGKEEGTTVAAPELGKKTGTSVAKSGLLFIEKAAELTGEGVVTFVNLPEVWVRGAES
jgi:hypothetical protein